MRIYLDHNATSPLRPEARSALELALDAGNPSSVHRDGQRARGIVETARYQVADILNLAPADLVFCSGATEAINLAFHVAARAGRGRMIVGAVEHDAVHSAAMAHGDTVEICPVDKNGVIVSDALEGLLTASDRPAIVAVQAANNETGVVQPIARITRLAREAGAWMLIDAVQMAGRLPFDAGAIGAEFVTVSAHKLGGPKGVGALGLKPGIHVPALIAGGGQEHGRRGGTENVPGIAGFGAAAKAATASAGSEGLRLGALRNHLESQLKNLAIGIEIFGEDAPRLPNTCAFAIRGQSAETLLIALDMAGVAVSSGSACSSGKIGASHVLRAMGVDQDLASGALRVSLGWTTVEADIDFFLDTLTDILQRRAKSSAAA